MDLPRFLQIEPVGQCNLRCAMCPIQFRHDGRNPRPPAFMEFDVFCRLVDEFDALEELHLQGMGEPLMHPRFFDMVRYAAARGIRVSTNTNLTLLGEARARECVDSGLHTLHASLDGATKTTYEAIRVRGRFERVLRNLHRLADAKARTGAQQPHLALVAVAMRANLHELVQLVDLAADAGVEAVSVQQLCHDFGESALPPRYRPMREFVEDQTLLHVDPVRVSQAFDAARMRARSRGITLRLPRVRPRAHAPGTPGRERCDWPWRGTYVAFTGEAMPCCIVATPDRINFGNMAVAGAHAIWNSAAYEGFRRGLDSADAPEVCKGCAVYAGTF